MSDIIGPDMEQNRKTQLNYIVPKVRSTDWKSCFNIRETIRLPDTEYLRFRVQKLLEKHCNLVYI